MTRQSSICRLAAIIVLSVPCGCESELASSEERGGQGESTPSQDFGLSRKGGAKTSICLSPDGKVIAKATNDAVSSTDPTLHLLDAASQREIGVISGDSVFPQHILCLAFHPDGKSIAVGCRDRIVRLWNIDKLKETPRTIKHQQAIHGIAFDPNGKWLATVSQDSCCRKWQLDDLKQLAQDAPRTSSSNSIAISADGKFLAWGGDRSVRVLNSEDFSLVAEFPEEQLPLAKETRPPRRPLNGRPVSIAGIAMSPDGDVLAYALAPRGLVIRKGDGWNEETRIELASNSTCVAFTRDGSRLFVGTVAGLLGFDPNKPAAGNSVTLPDKFVSSLSPAADSDEMAVLIGNQIEILKTK